MGWKSKDRVTEGERCGKMGIVEANRMRQLDLSDLHVVHSIAILFRDNKVSETVVDVGFGVEVEVCRCCCYNLAVLALTIGRVGQAAREYAVAAQPEGLHMQLGGCFERAT
ncbi:hypothetical protein Ancab_035839 [Ancistrocladus abbreviatus]